jgi:hypothetical protein
VAKVVVTCTWPAAFFRVRSTAHDPASGASISQYANCPWTIFIADRLCGSGSIAGKTERSKSFLPLPSSSAFIATRDAATPSGTSAVKLASAFARTKLHSFAAPTGIQGCSAGQMKSGRIHLSRRALADQDESKEE